ncbi:phage regulatory CII family protein [Reyranella sp.]|uniref:phage regulatory CII family protein n=1 Tax=Reyranella sp. TaxID=1929291 RepID=UPI003F710E72
MTRPTFNPQTPCDPEMPKAAVRRVYEQLGGVKRAAIRLGRGKTQTYDYASMERPDELTFTQACALTGAESPALAEYLAMLAGGVFLPVACTAADALQLTAEAVRQNGEAMGAIVAGVQDGTLDAAEARTALVELDEAIGGLCSLRSHLMSIIRPSLNG